MTLVNKYVSYHEKVNPSELQVGTSGSGEQFASKIRLVTKSTI